MFTMEEAIPEEDWGRVVCISVGEHRELLRSVETLTAYAAKRTRQVRFFCSTACFLLLLFLGSLITNRTLWRLMVEAKTVAEQCVSERKQLSGALDTLARTHASLLDAKEHIGRIGSEEAWGRKFHVTQYAPSAGGINADSDPSTTSTMRKADPSRRIVAVDPKVVPYGSWIWIEDLGWYEAQDTGGAIKGFKLDVMVHRSKEAMQWGRQDRFALVVPPNAQGEDS